MYELTVINLEEGLTFRTLEYHLYITYDRDMIMAIQEKGYGAHFTDIKTSYMGEFLKGSNSGMFAYRDEKQQRWILGTIADMNVIDWSIEDEKSR
jgi:hypothetical protein